MSHFEGQIHIPVPLVDVAARLSDAGYLARSLKDAEIVEATPDKAVWRMKPKISFLSGTQTTEMTRSEYRSGEAVAYTLTTRSIGGSATVTTQLRFHPYSTGTAVDWTADITELTGLFKMVPSGLMQEAAHRVIEEVWQAVRSRITSEAGTDTNP